MAYAVEGTDQFADWYLALEADDQDAVDFAVQVLEQDGWTLGRPFVDAVRNSHFANMEELRVQSKGNPLRIFFAFDPRRTAILLIGGDKTGEGRFYDPHDSHRRQIVRSPPRRDSQGEKITCQPKSGARFAGARNSQTNSAPRQIVERWLTAGNAPALPRSKSCGVLDT